jgi:hypothetical protein
LVIFGCFGLSFAAAVETTTASARVAGVSTGGVEQVVAVADGASGYTQNIDVRGSASVREYPKQIASVTGLDLSGGKAALVSGECYISGIVVSGPAAAAGDYVLIYDALTVTGTAKFDVSIGTAKNTIPISIPGGAKFTTGVSAQSNSTAVHLTVIYDN